MEVFGSMSWSQVHLGAENLVEPSSGTSRALSGSVLGGPGGVLATNWASIWGAFSSFSIVFWRFHLMMRFDSIFKCFLSRFCQHFDVPSSFVQLPFLEHSLCDDEKHEGRFIRKT